MMIYKKKCVNCELWEDNLQKLFSASGFIAATRPHMVSQNPDDHAKVFDFCPWCSYELVDNPEYLE